MNPTARASTVVRRRRLGLAALALLATAASCKTSQAFFWIESVPKTMLVSDASADIHPGDVIGIRVWNQEANSVDRTRVRDDGRISVPFLNDVECAGMQPGDLAKRLEVRLKAFIVNPVVTVLIHERRPTRVSVLGQVTRPGVYDLDTSSGVLHALAAAGGTTAFADPDGVYVLRTGYWADLEAAPARIRFRMRDLEAGKVPAALFRMRPGDVVVVE